MTEERRQRRIKWMGENISTTFTLRCKAGAPLGKQVVRMQALSGAYVSKLFGQVNIIPGMLAGDERKSRRQARSEALAEAKADESFESKMKLHAAREKYDPTGKHWPKSNDMFGMYAGPYWGMWQSKSDGSPLKPAVPVSKQ